MMKKTDQSSSLPQSQEQPPRAKKYRQRGVDEGQSNSVIIGSGNKNIEMQSQVGSNMSNSQIPF